MGKKPAKASAKATSSSKGAAAKNKAGSKKQRDSSSSSSSGYGSLHDPLDRQLALLGLRVKNITADGNCFFRALSDQLQGDEHRHSELRGQVVSLMRDKADGFAPFVEDDMSLDDHLGRMKKEGVWAGHMELQAASLLLQVNIAIYQAGQPRWCITNFPTGSPLLHLSYHDGEHYNSVRRADDYSRGNPADIPETLQPVADVAQARRCWSAADEQRVAEGTGCDNPVLIRQQLEKSGGNVDTAIEAVIEVMAGDDYEDGTAAAAAVDAGNGGEGAVSYSGDSRASAAVSQDAEQPPAATAAAAVGSTMAVGSSEVAEVQGPTATAPATVGQEERQQLPSETSSSHSLAASLEQDQQKGSSSSKPLEASPGDPAVTSQPSTDAPQAPAATAATAAAEVTPPEAATDGGSVGVGPGSSKKQTGLKGHKLKGSSSSAAAAAAGSSRRGGDRAPSRNKPCPCGSGRKHKVCCGKAAVAVQEVDPPAYKLPKSVTWADEEGPGVLTHTLHI